MARALIRPPSSSSRGVISSCITEILTKPAEQAKQTGPNGHRRQSKVVADLLRRQTDSEPQCEELALTRLQLLERHRKVGEVRLHGGIAHRLRAAFQLGAT